jgi:molybdate transport system substrate-binding protein
MFVGLKFITINTKPNKTKLNRTKQIKTYNDCFAYSGGKDMKKKILRMLLTTMMTGALLLTGCSSDAGSSSVAADSGDQATEQTVEETTDVYVFIAASLSNAMDEIKTMYEEEHPEVNIIFNADSSGTLQTQIEEGAQCDIFFSAATKQMDALKEGGYVIADSVTNLLENKIVLIKPTGGETTVTGFDNITNASSLALAGEDVPVGQYARTLFENIGILDQVQAMEINEGANVTAVLTAVAEGSNEVGVVYATDAASMADSVEVIAEATPEQVDPAVYPIGLINDAEATDAEVTDAAEFKDYITTNSEALKVLTDAGFKKYTE